MKDEIIRNLQRWQATPEKRLEVWLKVCNRQELSEREVGACLGITGQRVGVVTRRIFEKIRLDERARAWHTGS